MTKILYTGSLAILLAFGSAHGKTLSPEEALQRLDANPVASAATRGGVSMQNAELVHTTLTTDGEPAAYVFNADRGYMVLSADDIAYPVLGYSPDGYTDPDNMPDALKWWLEEYSRQIAYAKSKGISASMQTRSTRADRQAIEPMIKTHWDQGEPYNRFCPIVGGMRGYTGCVATAMAQIAYYWKYPAIGQGKISYNDDEGCGKRLTWDFSQYPFEWDKMIPEYIEGRYTDEQADAVSVLMRSIGASVKMSYAEDSSGALSLYTRQGWVKYLGYDPNIEYVLRSTVSPSQWDQMIYDNLLNVGPVLYGGGSMLGGGHSFIVDGYDGHGYYHFNWGWSQMSDGYFSLDALNPSSLGTGGGAGGGYNFTQDGVFGIQPPTGKPAVEKPVSIFQMGTLSGEIDGSVLSLTLIDEGSPMWVNYNPSTVKVQFGCIISNEKNPGFENINRVISDQIFSLQPGYGANANMLEPSVDFSEYDLPDGDYRVTMATLEEKEGANWVAMDHNHGYANYVVVNKTGDTYTVTNNPTPGYTINSIEFVGNLYYGCSTRVKFSITNETDTEISRGLAPILFTTDGQIAFLGESKFLTLQPGQTIEDTFISDMYLMNSNIQGIAEDTEFLLTVFEESSYDIMSSAYLEKVVMHPNPGQPKVRITPSLTIKDAKFKTEQAENGMFDVYYEVEDPTDIHATCGVRLTDGIVAYPVYICLLDLQEDGQNYGIVDYQGGHMFLSKPNEHQSIDAHFNFKTAIPGKTYYMQVAYGLNSGLYPLDNNIIKLRVSESAGVDGILADAGTMSYNGSEITCPDGVITVYNLQGVKVAENAAAISTSGWAAGVYIARCGEYKLKVIVR